LRFKPYIHKNTSHKVLVVERPLLNIMIMRLNAPPG
jgi:hypothetical protein